MTNRIGRRGLAAGAALLPAGFVTAAHAQTANETTLARIQRSKTIRIAALSGQMPYFSKDISSGEWTGACVDMANSLAKVFDAKIEWVEATYGTSVLDLQTNKVDLGFALNPTPERALSIGFTHPMLIHPFGCVSKTLSPKTWDDLNKPNIRIAYDIGSLHETLAKRFCPNAQNMGFPNTDQAILALQTGRVDVVILAAMLGLSAIGKNPSIGKYLSAEQPECRPAILPGHSGAVFRLRHCHQRVAGYEPRHRAVTGMADRQPGENGRQAGSVPARPDVLTHAVIAPARYGR